MFTFKESREEKDVERKEESGEKRRGVRRMERSKNWRGGRVGSRHEVTVGEARRWRKGRI